jgi:outer membrane protein OmpA-like peptidoglycan-associated protein
MAIAAFCLAALGLLPSPGAFAQTGAAAAPAKSEVLKGTDVTPDNLVDALAPPEAAEPLTRGLRLRVERDRPAGGTVAVKRTAVSLLITFLTNSSTLTTPSRQQLDTLATALKDDRLINRKFSIEGHADPRGNERTNLQLSQQRADSVRQYLVTLGVAPERLTPVGKGSTELMNTDDVAAPENRRVTIVTRPN